MQDSGFSIQDIQPTHAHKSISMQVIAAKLKEINAGRSCRGDGEGVVYQWRWLHGGLRMAFSRNEGSTVDNISGDKEQKKLQLELLPPVVDFN